MPGKPYNHLSQVAIAIRLACSLCVCVLPVSALAGPAGGNIVAGSGSINQSGLVTDIHQGSSSLAINWSSFNLRSDEIVNYLQPGSSSIALNRILSNDGSRIQIKKVPEGLLFDQYYMI